MNTYKLIGKFSAIVIIAIILYNICKIEVMTHISKDDLLWGGEYKSNEYIIFKNDTSCMKDTMVITKIVLNNSIFPLMNPFLKWNCGPDYEANCFEYFEIYHDSRRIPGRMSIIFRKNKKIVDLEFTIGNLDSDDEILDGFDTHENDCIIIDSINTTSNPNSVYQTDTDSINYLDSFKWKKGIGLESYKYINGETYSLLSK